MNPKSKILITLSFASAAGAVAMAQDSIPIRYTRPMRNTISVGLRIVSSGANVKFSGLGNVPSLFTASTDLSKTDSTLLDKFVDSTTGKVLDESYRPFNSYDNGIVAEDSRRYASGYSEYLYNNAQKTPAPDYSQLAPISGNFYTTIARRWVIQKDESGRDIVNPDGSTNRIYFDKDESGTGFKTEKVPGTANLLSYKAGQTRMWQTAEDAGAQYLVDENNKTVAARFDRFELMAQERTKSAQSGAAPGFEIELDHIIRKESLRFEWGVKFGLGLSSINAKDSGGVDATLRDHRDIYALAPGFTLDKAGYGFGSTSTPVLNTDGTSEITAPLSLSFLRQETIDKTVQVKGFWQIKGAYYMVRIGPSARYYFSPRLSVSATAGIAGAYFGTTYRIQESYNLATEGLSTKTLSYDSAQDEERSRTHGFSAGYYGQFNFEWWLTPSTGFYVGLGYEKLGSYTQSVKRYGYDTSTGKLIKKEIAYHRAAIELGQGGVVRLGVNTRF